MQQNILGHIIDATSIDTHQGRNETMKFLDTYDVQKHKVPLHFIPSQHEAQWCSSVVFFHIKGKYYTSTRENKDL